jgi:hypothetical protein
MRAAVLALLICASCKTADFGSGHLRCAATTPMCPSGFHCAADGACWRDGENPDLAMSMSLPDLAVDLAFEPDFAVAEMAPVDMAYNSTADLTPDDSGCAPVDPAGCCGTLYTLCGTVVNCTGSCVPFQKLCGVVQPNQCDCPAPGRTGIFRATNNSGASCYSNGDSAYCPGFTVDSAPQFFVYTGDPPPSMTALVRCNDAGKYTLSIDPTCGGTGNQDLAIGYIPTTQACGTVALHRYDTGTHLVYTTNPAQAPQGSTEVLPPFNVWLN